MTILDEFNEFHYTGESTDSNIKILLNLKENDYLDYDYWGWVNFDFDNLEDIFVDYINRETEELNEENVRDLLDKDDLFDTQAIYMLLEENDWNLSFITSHYHLIKVSRLFALQEQLRESIDEWKWELKKELDIRFNKLIALWKTRSAQAKKKN